MRRLGFVLVALLALPTAVAAEGHPQTLGKRDRDRGYEWVAASRVLTSDGFVKAGGVHERLRKGLEEQLQQSAADHGLEDGEVPATKQWCAPPYITADYPLPEGDGRFISALLLSEVAVTATLGEAIPGFFVNGNPGTLFALSNVVPLHGQSPSVEYVLVPFDRLVVHGRVFCAVNPSTPKWSGKTHPKVGDRVALLAAWPKDGVVRTNMWNHGSSLGLVFDDGRLQWDNLVSGPGNLASLQERVDEAVSGRLFELTTHLVSQEYGSAERREFVETWRSYESDGCRVVGVAERPGHGLVPSRFVCPSKRAK